MKKRCQHIVFFHELSAILYFRPTIMRPLPGNSDDLESAIMNENNNEDDIDAASVTDRRDNVDGSYELDDLDNIDNKNYEDRIEDALRQLNENKD